MKGVIGGALAALLVTCAVPAAAQQAASGEPSAFGSVPVAATELSAITGREDTALLVRAENTATVSHNSVSGQSQTGTINFDPSTLQGMSGLSLLSANTGNNVAINSSLNVNVSIAPR